MGNGIFTPYGTSTKYYALCTTTDGVTSIKMYQCATGATFNKSPSVSKCVFTCTAAGKFAYSLDEKKYYNCVKNANGSYSVTIVSCDPGIFLPSSKDCGFPASLQNTTMTL